MFVVIQYPMADLRPVLKERAGRLLAPDWAHEQANKGAFVRNLGPFGLRQAGGIDGMAGERVTADCRNAVRFHGPVHCESSATKEIHPLRVWFRRLYYDGQITGRFEIGLATDPFWRNRRVQQSKDVSLDVEDLCRALEAVRITITGDGIPPVKTPLLAAGDALSLSYLTVTTSHEKRKEFPPSENVGYAVNTGDPLIYVRCPRSESLVTAKHARLIPLDSPGFSEMRCVVYMQKALRLPIWSRSSAGSEPTIEPRGERSLRVMLSRLNAESFALGHLTRTFALFPERLKVDPKRAADLDALITLALGQSAATDAAEVDVPKPTGNHAELGEAETIFRSLLPGRREEVLRNLQALAAQREQAKNKTSFFGAVKTFAASFVETAERTTIEFWLNKATGG